MKSISEKTSSCGFKTKLPPEKVIAAAERFFSSRRYKVQLQGPDWIMFEPENNIPLLTSIWTLIGIGAVVSIGIFNTLLNALIIIPVTFSIVVIVGAVVWGSLLLKSSTIRITVETLSPGTLVKIKYPPQKKVKKLIKNFIPLLLSNE